MSILIKGMEMPIGDDWRTIKIHSDGSVWRLMIRGDCALIKGVEAVELPTPHGELVDKRELLEIVSIMKGEAFMDGLRGVHPDMTHYLLVEELLDDVPVIIEAEEQNK